MNKEQLRMQMLAGVITESQYKKEMEEADSMGRIGKSYNAPGNVSNGDKLNLSKKWMKKWKPKFKQIKTIMNRYEDQDPIDSFIDFAHEVESELNWEFYLNLRWANPPTNGFRYNFVWAIDNVAADPSQESKIPTKDIIYRGGPGNSWILRDWD